jgi:hypothetical protein
MRHGATLGDAAIALITFAQTKPRLFILTVPVTAALALVFCVLILRIVVIGPLSRNQREVNDRAKRPPQEPRLPL